MPVYALYVSTANHRVPGIRLERFASRELTGRILLERNATGRSLTYHLPDGRPARIGDRPEAVYPLADSSGYMRVFLRKAADEVPDLRDVPDEEWIVEKGGRRGKVVRLPWKKGREKTLVNRFRDRLTVIPRTPDHLAAGSFTVRSITCMDSGCGKIFEAATPDYPRFAVLLRDQGWRMRGSVVGFGYFCGDHARPVL